MDLHKVASGERPISIIERSLIYVSRKLIDASAEQPVADIVAYSEIRNAALNVTGTLVSTGDYFAQILEGTGDALDALMDSIHRDARHTDVTILRVRAISHRNFPGWAMAYSGDSQYLSGRIAPLVGIDATDDDARVSRLIAMMTGLDLARKAAS